MPQFLAQAAVFNPRFLPTTSFGMHNACGTNFFFFFIFFLDFIRGTNDDSMLNASVLAQAAVFNPLPLPCANLWLQFRSLWKYERSYPNVTGSCGNLSYGSVLAVGMATAAEEIKHAPNLKNIVDILRWRCEPNFLVGMFWLRA
ncbi:hypothetical protein CEXT_799931 [Caerostris extrusa]|uniref:Uncharacterized protein n=1 Tax=Caerostris extrusa TaxID=172846 RepID=A0AAV4QFK6_CAEEX|nr:hypothetical protein CEXT_799931 [Caerostris extrusa]